MYLALYSLVKFVELNGFGGDKGDDNKSLKVLKDKGFDFGSHCKKRLGDGHGTRFWIDVWTSDMPLCVKFPRLFALELDKDASVASKMAGPLDFSFRRSVRDGSEQQQMLELVSIVDTVSLSPSHDRWVCDLSGDGQYRVKVIRSSIDDLFLPSFPETTRWVKYVPIKVNIFVWRARRDCIPTRSNLVRRGVSLDSSSCPLCDSSEEDTHHVLFRCSLAQAILRRVCRWWDLEWHPWISFLDWQVWLSAIRVSAKVKSLLEGVFYMAWWSIWNLRIVHF
ncbi:RNA-directed DNA polymerase, eukaryota [Tanacetum coccineum]